MTGNTTTMRRRLQMVATSLIVLMAAGGSALALTDEVSALDAVLTAFEDGEVLHAADLNARFAAVKSAAKALDARHDAMATVTRKVINVAAVVVKEVDKESVPGPVAGYELTVAKTQPDTALQVTFSDVVTVGSAANDSSGCDFRIFADGAPCASPFLSLRDLAPARVTHIAFCQDLLVGTHTLALHFDGAVQKNDSCVVGLGVGRPGQIFVQEVLFSEVPTP